MKNSTKRKFKKVRFALNKNLFSIYAGVKYNKRVWRFLNRKSINDFEENKPQLSDLQYKLLNDLNKKGIAVTHLDDLFADRDILRELNVYLEKRFHRVSVNTKKPFLDDLLAEVPDLGTEVPFFNLAVDPTILNVVNSYMGMYSKLFYYCVRRTKLSGNKLPSHSQNWHRAPQEQKNCRVYIYLSDVDETAGPFMYIPESVRGKKYGHIAQQNSKTRGYHSAEVVESVIPESDRKTILGKAGTVIFCDSTGLHRGGYSNQKTRTMSTFGYGAPSFRENINYSYPSSLITALKENPLAIRTLNSKWQR